MDGGLISFERRLDLDAITPAIFGYEMIESARLETFSAKFGENLEGNLEENVDVRATTSF